MNDIFLSYASEDRERLRPLIAALGAEGWSVFWDRTIPTGKSWRQFIGVVPRQGDTEEEIQPKEVVTRQNKTEAAHSQLISSLPHEPEFYVLSEQKFLILSIATCGMFYFYWFYRHWKNQQLIHSADIVFSHYVTTSYLLNASSIASSRLLPFPMARRA